MTAKYRIERYTKDKNREWDAFVKSARNSTFLFQREYMDYHSDRFVDCSWMVYNGSRLVAVLPANITGDGILHSHQGLTYGGLVLSNRRIDGGDVGNIFSSMIEKWRYIGISGLDYKTLPYIYAERPSQEDIWWLMVNGASVSRCELSSTIALYKGFRPETLYNSSRKQALASTRNADYTIERIYDAEWFMDFVSTCLAERHNAVPVHSGRELKMLMERFADEIKLYVIRENGVVQACVCIYDTGRVVHTQYIASTAEGRERNMLTRLIHTLICDASERGAKYFDFGTSTGTDAHSLNEGLMYQKSSFGATGVSCIRVRLCIE